MKHFFIRLWSHTSVRVALIGVCIVCVGGSIIYAGGWYPIAQVDGTFISARAWRLSYTLAYNYYTNLGNQANVRMMSDAEMRKATYDGLIDDVCITHELRARLSKDELSEKIQMRIQDMVGSTDALRQALELTRMSEKNTRTYFLEPMARQQILVSVLSMENQDVMQWLLKARASARVSVWFEKGTWEGERGYKLNDK